MRRKNMNVIALILDTSQDPIFLLDSRRITKHGIHVRDTGFLPRSNVLVNDHIVVTRV
jgi:hypothetical protein